MIDPKDDVVFKEFSKMMELRSVMGKDIMVAFHVTDKHVTLMQVRRVTSDDMLVESDDVVVNVKLGDDYIG